MARTLFDKVWEAHVVSPETDETPTVLYIDLHLIHEVTSPQAFTVLRERGLPVRRIDRTLATMDHSTPTTPVHTVGDIDVVGPSAAAQIRQMESNCVEFGIPLRGFDSDERGIVHIIGPELGATQPGKTIVCGDSHTSTHGAFGALAFGIGTTEVGHVLATQCLLQRRPKTMAVEVDGSLPPGVTAKDLILAIIGKIGVDGGTGHVIEYRGDAIRGLDMAGRMTVCNMSIEGGARAGMIAPDDTTFEYLAGRKLAPQGADFDAAVARWRELATDDGARYDKVVHIDASTLAPMVTFGTNPGMVVPIDAPLPAAPADGSWDRALEYMRLVPAIGFSGASRMYSSARSQLPSAGAAGSGSSMGTTMPGLVPKVTIGVRVPALIDTDWSNAAPSSVRRLRQRATAASQSSPAGTRSRPCRYSNVVSSGAIMPARAPPSIDMLQTVIRSSMEKRSKTEPPYS